MKRLDEIEIAYKRVEGRARMYDGTTCTATVYTQCSSLTRNHQENNPPFQRYLDIMIEGARHFGMNPKGIDMLELVACRPRPLPHEFKAFQEPAEDAPLLSYEEDVLPFNGRSSPILRLAVNGKVKEIDVDKVSDPLFKNSLNFYKQYGQRLEFVFSRVSTDCIATSH